MRIDALAQQISAELAAGTLGDVEVTGVASVRRATASSVVFAENEVALREAFASAAGAVIARAEMLSADALNGAKPILVASHPKLVFARAAQALHSGEHTAGVHATAIIGTGAVLGEAVSIGAYAVIGDRCRIGAGTRIGAGCVLGEGVEAGPECHIYPRVVLYPEVTLGARVTVHAGAVLGADGFGYVRDPQTGAYLQFPQQGTLVLEDDVEIGANVTIDRGALEETRIARGTKIDNLVHVGHNVTVGEDVVIAAQTGISGSSSIGNGAIIGGQVGMGEHATVGDSVILGGQAGILPGKKLRGPGVVFWGTPAKPLKAYLKELAAVARLARSSRE